MPRLFRTALLVALVLVWTGSAVAQVVTRPSPADTPLGQNVSGFFSIALGAVVVPKFDAKAVAVSDDFSYQTYQEQASLPGLSAHASLIPAFGNNGIGIEGGYEVIGMRWKQSVSDIQGTYKGDSTLSMSMTSFSVNYLRYFLSGADRVYLLLGGGYAWTTGRMTSETGDDGKTSDAGFPNWRANTGFGYLHQMRTGAVGAELRADFPLLDTEFTFEDAKGEYDITLEHPVMLRLAVTFAIGRLIER